MKKAKKSEETTETTETVVTVTERSIEESQELEHNYENYRLYPISLVESEDTLIVKVDGAFVTSCHDYGRSLFFSDYDTECAMEQAKLFIDALVFPVVKKERHKETTYMTDMVARSFGLAFAHLGYSTPNDDLTQDIIGQLTTQTLVRLEQSGIME